MARTLMIQGTASHVGKSTLVAALCRLFANRGVSVAPFKAQNMSNNSFVTPDGREIGRAQAVQAAACRLAPRSDFNPVLIKPSSEREAQIVLDGYVTGTLNANDFGRIRRECFDSVREAFDRVSQAFDLVILEGAGSPAEINLRDHDIVNMRMAKEARTPVLLIGDIDRGGAFASIAGTLVLLDESERHLVKGWMFNKFRGSQSLLESGILALEEMTGVRCLGVLPYLQTMAIPEEDSVSWDSRWKSYWGRTDSLRVGVVALPFASNVTDVEALGREPDVHLVKLTEASKQDIDLLVIPGCKTTAEGATFLKENGFSSMVQQVLDKGGTVVGLCGGYQLLGRAIKDPYRVESDLEEYEGLGQFNIETVFKRQKTTVQVNGTHRQTGHRISGYEVHMGVTQVGDGLEHPFEIKTLGETRSRLEGASDPNERLLGTYIHGVFDEPEFRRAFLNRLRAQRGWNPIQVSHRVSLDAELDHLADWASHHLNIEEVTRLIEKGI